MDDDPVVLHLLSALLAESGVDCLRATSGRTALRTLAEEVLSLDLLITDVVMPDIGGDALVLAVRELGGEQDLPILVASAYVAGDRAQALREAGADAVVDKAGGLDPVVATALSLLAGRRVSPPQAGPEPVARVTPQPARSPSPVARIGLTRVHCLVSED